MRPINQAQISFDSRSVNEGFGRAAVAAFLSQLDPTVADLTDMKTAVSEAVTNAIVHGYASTGRGTVRLHAVYTDEAVLSVDVIDRGCGIADVEHARQPFFTTAEGEERSGMGFTVMESFMDAVEVRSAVGEGTTVRLVKRLDTRAETLARRA